MSNLPYGVCSFPPLHIQRPRCCTIVGTNVVDLSVLAEAGLFDDAFSAASSVASSSGNNNNGNISPVRVFGSSTLNRFMELDRPIWTAVRRRLFALLVDNDGGDDALMSNDALRAAAIRNVGDARVHLPAKVGDYTDFYSSREHATNGMYEGESLVSLAYEWR